MTSLYIESLFFARNFEMNVRAGPRGVVYGGGGGGGGGTSSRRLEPSGVSRERGEEALAYWRGVPGVLPRKFFKIYVSENAFQAILKPFFSIFYNLSFK